MTRKFVFCALIFIVASCGKKPREGIALVVNGYEIPAAHVMQTAELLRESMISAFPEKAVEGISSELLAGAAQQLIAHRVLLEEAQQAGIMADSTEIDSLYSSLRNRVPDQAAFERELTKMGETDSSLRYQISEGILLEKLMKRIFTSARQIDSQACRAFYEENKNQYLATARVRASQIFLPYPDSLGESDRQKLKATAETVQQQLRSGVTFEVLAKKYSKGPGAPDGGDIGWFKKGDLKADLEDPLFRLNKGGISDIISTDVGMFILQKTDEEAQRQLAFEEVAERIRFLLEIKERNRLVSGHIDSLIAKAKVVYLDTTLAHVPEGGMNILPGMPQ